MICISLSFFLISQRPSFLMSAPSKRISPAVGSIKRRRQRPVVVFPHPDSPTMPSVFPLSTEKFTPSTAWSIPRPVLKYFFRLRTSRMMSSMLSPLDHESRIIVGRAPHRMRRRTFLG